MSRARRQSNNFIRLIFVFNFRVFNFHDHARPQEFFILNIYSGKICAHEKY